MGIFSPKSLPVTFENATAAIIIAKQFNIPLEKIQEGILKTTVSKILLRRDIVLRTVIIPNS